MAKRLPILFLLSVGLSLALAYICDNDASSPPDDFEEHGCFCGTTNISYTYPVVLDMHREAFEGCHEDESDDGDLTIECGFLQAEAFALKSILNRTILSEIPVVANGTPYSRIKCL